MVEKIVIGKHTLESLTSGMYSDPFVVYREYIQNCVDSLDCAVEHKVLSKDEGEIIVSLYPSEHQIQISDNGIGLSSKEAERTLVSIGNSKKKSSSSRGFRGIGRLAALGYCTELVFRTSYCGEPVGTEIRLDASKLALLLSANEKEDTSIVDVMQQVYSSEQFQEKESSHYFSVFLNGVDQASRLYDYNEVFDYLAQNVPVPYNPIDFALGKEIEGRLSKEGFCPKSYNIFLSLGTSRVKVFKPYSNSFLVDKGKNIRDSIKDLEIIRITNKDGNISAIGWVGITNYYGSIYDRLIKGIRLRKGNILIGDSQTLNVVFKDARFNGWSIGEVFAVGTDLIPNARRDNFEKNSSYFAFIEQLTKIASKITKEIRAASLKRNANLEKALEQASQAQDDTTKALKSGVSSTRKGSLKQKLENAKDMLTMSSSADEMDSYCQAIAFEELDMLIGRLKGATSYKALNSIDNLSNTEKKILERVFNVIDGLKISSSSTIIDAIIESFASKTS